MITFKVAKILNIMELNLTQGTYDFLTENQKLFMVRT